MTINTYDLADEFLANLSEVAAQCNSDEDVVARLLQIGLLHAGGLQGFFRLGSQVTKSRLDALILERRMVAHLIGRDQ